MQQCCVSFSEAWRSWGLRVLQRNTRECWKPLFSASSSVSASIIGLSLSKHERYQKCHGSLNDTNRIPEEETEVEKDVHGNAYMSWKEIKQKEKEQRAGVILSLSSFGLADPCWYRLCSEIGTRASRRGPEGGSQGKET